MAKVFISYSRKDIEFAKKLTGELQKNELDFWVDWEGIPPTVDWWKQIEKGIEEADAFIFLISPDSAASKICAQEIDCAVKNSKRIIPLVVRDTKGDESPKQLSHLNWIFFREQDDFNAGLQKLLTAIHTDYDWVQNHRRLQVKALEWERNTKESGFLLRGKDLQDAEMNLAANTSKEPHPTDLQREYVHQSRKSTDRQRQLLTGISIAGVIALALLAVFGFVQAGEAISQKNIALTAQADAVQAKETAIANEVEAKKQAQIALARQLASQAKSIYGAFNAKQMIAALLNIQSMKLFPNGDAANFLINSNQAGLPIARMVHDGPVTIVAFSPDGKYVVSGGNDKTVRVWETSTGEETARMTHDDDGVTSVAFSPDGKYVVSGGYDGIARVWEAESGLEVARMVHDNGVNSVAFSPDGKYVVSGGCDKLDESGYCAQSSARVWEAGTGKETAHMTHDSGVTTVAFSPDGKYVVSGSYDNTARVWEASTGKEIAHMTHDNWVYSVAFSSDGKYVVSGSDDGTARVWESGTGKETARMTNGSTLSVAFSPDGKYVVSSGDDNTARVWEASTGKETARMTHDEFVTSVAFSPDGSYVVSGGYDGIAHVWKADPEQEMARMTHDEFVFSFAFSPDGNYLVSGGCDKLHESGYCAQSSARVWEAGTGKEIARMTNDGNVPFVAFSSDGKYMISDGCDKLDESGYCAQNYIRVWEAGTGKETARMTHDPSGYTFYTFSPDGKYVLSGGCDKRDDSGYCTQGSARVWEANTGKEIARMPHDDGVSSVAFSPDGKYVVSGGDATAHVWEASTGKEMARMAHDGNVFSVAFSPDGKYVLSSGDKTARVWEASTGKETARMTHDSSVYTVAFSPDGKYVVSCDNTTARVWEADTGKEIARMTHDGNVFSIAFSPDGKYVVSGSDDGSARVWEASTGEEVARMTHDGGVLAAFSPDGKYVLSSGDKTARVWEWQPEDLITNACAVMPRNLTRAEWNQFVGDALPYQAVCENLPLEAEVTSTPTVTP